MIPIEALYSCTFQQHKHEQQTSYIVVREFLILKLKFTGRGKT